MRYERYRAVIRLNDDITLTAHFDAPTTAVARHEVVAMLRDGIGSDACVCCETFSFDFSIRPEVIENALIEVKPLRDVSTEVASYCDPVGGSE